LAWWNGELVATGYPCQQRRLSMSKKVIIHGNNITSSRIIEMGNFCKYEAHFRELCGPMLCLSREEQGGTSAEKLR
jgi:hypothetical protein